MAPGLKVIWNRFSIDPLYPYQESQANARFGSGLDLRLKVILVNRLLDFRTTGHRRLFKSLTGTELLHCAGFLKFLLVLFESLVDGFVFFNRNYDHGLLNKGGKDRKET